MSSSPSSSSSDSDSPQPARKRKQVSEEEVETSSSNDSGDDEGPAVPEEDELVLSHAERRRQKKKELKAEKESKSPSKKRKLDDGSAAKTITTTGAASRSSKGAKPNRQNSVWVGNLSFWTSQEALKEFFHGAGEITRIHMPMKRGKQGENMGLVKVSFAYVDFATPDAKVTAITLSEGQLEGRNLLIKDGNDFNGRPAVKAPESAEEGTATPAGPKAPSTGLTKTAQKILRIQKQPPAPTLFLGNLGFETTEDSIRQLFIAHRHFKQGGDKGKGKDVAVKEENEDQEKVKDLWIRKIRMGTFEDSGACKGFAFVDFTSIEHATNALTNPRNHRLNGRDLVVEYASAEAVRRGGGGPRPPKQERGGGRNEKSSFERTPRRHSHSNRQEVDEETAMVEVNEEPVSTPRFQRPNRGGGDRPHRGRAKPGAALAQAPRQSAAIVPAQNQKIVF
ncbi:hypothetical protein HYDPIDRAFT_171849 [Hydnomerulius pinastri MD-312]|nr:hypothetical protein HYDPIDRAFT_171849 [Hydnomerulius pinastri MD-312]